MRDIFAAGLGIVVLVLGACTVGPPGAGHLGPDRRDAPASVSPIDREQSLEAFANLPLGFIENQGQIDERVRYYAQGSGYGFYLTPQELVLSFDKGATATRLGANDTSAKGRGSAPDAPAPDGISLALQFLEANPNVELEAVGHVPGEINYIRGDDPARWRTELSQSEEVVYRRLWPGVDLMLTGQAGTLKYEFRVAPGARPDAIRLAYAGADDLALDGAGGLLIDTAMGQLQDSPPVAWQEIAGARVPVESHYALNEQGPAQREYGFTVGTYDPDHELIIDPGLDFSTFLGGSSMDRGDGIGVDSNGNSYIVGTTQSTDLPTTTGAFDRTFNGGVTDVFVAKLNATGSGLVYATYLGGTPTPLRRGGGDNVEFGRSIAVDSGGNAYVTGLTDSSNFPTTAGAFQPSINVLPLEQRNDARDAFVTKLNPSGSGLVYSTFLGGFGFDDGQGIALDGSGNAYVVGDTDSSNFPTTSGAIQTTPGGGRDAFATKLNATGSNVAYSTYLGGTDNEVGNGVAVDAVGNAYVVGGTRSANFPTTTGAFDTTHNGGAFDELFDAFVTKLNGNGSPLYSTFLGGSKMDTAGDVAVDGASNAYVVGGTLSLEFPTTSGAFDTVFSGSSESFATKLNAAGSALVYSTFLGGGGSSAIVLDAADNAWITGTAGQNAPTTADAFSGVNSGGNDAWLGQLNAAGSAFLFATFIGGSNTDNGVDVALDGNGHAYVAGTTISFDFPTTVGAFDNTFDGDPLIFWGDAFVAKFGAGTGTPAPPPTQQTDTFSGPIDRNQTRTHTLLIGATGTVDLKLEWTEPRANLTLQVRDPGGTQVFFAGGTARPKVGTFQAARTGQFSFVIANTTSRRTNYTLTVSHPQFSSFPAAVSLLTLNPTTVTGGTSSTGTVSLTAAAPSGGATVALTSSNTPAATVPASVSVPAGQTSATFTVSTNTVTANTTSTITASYNGTSRTATLGVNAAGGPAMSTLTLNPTTVQGGSSSTGTATLTAPAPSGGAVVTLLSSNTDVATVPASVTVPAGSTSATFTVSTSAQSFNQSSSISASHGGVTRSVILSVTAGGTTTDSVTISRAEYDSGNRILRVEASSSSSGATLRVHVSATNELIGTLSGGRGEFSWPTNPQNITVRSSLGGSATRAVTAK